MKIRPEWGGAESLAPLPTCGPMPSNTNKLRWFPVASSYGPLKANTTRDLEGVNNCDPTTPTTPYRTLPHPTTYKASAVRVQPEKTVPSEDT